MTLETTYLESDPTALETDAGGRWRDLLQPRYFASTVMLCLGVALFAFNEFFVSVALPSAIAELGKPWLLAWAFSLYLVVAILGGAMAAFLKGRFGARSTLVASAILFLAGTLLASFATNASHLIVGRLMQGFGDGIIIALCYALIPELFPKALVPKVFGSESIAWAAAAFGGPLIAGLLTQFVSWRASFASSIPAALAFILLVLVLVPRQQHKEVHAAPIPLIRLAAIGAAIFAVSLCSTTDDRWAMTALLIMAMASLWLFLRADRKATHAILPRNAFSARALPGPGLWVILLMPLASSAGAVYLIYGVQGVWMLKPAEAGLLSALMALSWSFTGIGIASVRSLEFRNRLIGLGPILVALGTAGLVVTMTMDLLWIAYPSQIAVGAGYGICWGSLSQLLMDRSAENERDKTSALLPTLQSTGYAIGGASYGLIANVSGLREGLNGHALRDVLAPLFVVAVAMALVSVVFGLRTVALSSAGEKQGAD